MILKSTSRWPRHTQKRAEKRTLAVSGCFVCNSPRTVLPSFQVRSLFAAIFVMTMALCAAAQAPERNLASGCASCHASQAATQPQTPMGRGLQLPGTDPTLISHPKLTFHKGGYTYTVETKGDQSTYSVTDGTNTITLPIRWNFGKAAQTWVFER